MRIAVSADEDTGVARAVLDQLRDRGHQLVPCAAASPDERDRANVAHLDEIGG